MAWIELHTKLPSHKKTKRLVRLLGLSVPQDIPQAVGHLCVLWLWAIENASDGTLNGFDAEDIADAAGWNDDPQVFLDAMVESGFLDADGDSYRIHDWMDYAGHYLDYKKRIDVKNQKNRERQKRFREKAKIGKKELEENKTDNNNEPEDNPMVDQQWLMVVRAYEKNIGMLPMGVSLENLISYTDDLGADIVCKAIEVTNQASPNNPHRYLQSILKKWIENKVDTLEKVEAYTKDLERRIRESRAAKAPRAESGPPAIEGKFY